jgi:hypothetical protein
VVSRLTARGNRARSRVKSARSRSTHIQKVGNTAPQARLEASANAPNGTFFSENLRRAGPVPKTWKSGFLRCAEIRTLLKWYRRSTRRCAVSHLDFCRPSQACRKDCPVLPLPEVLRPRPAVRPSDPFRGDTYSLASCVSLHGRMCSVRLRGLHFFLLQLLNYCSIVKR